MFKTILIILVVIIAGILIYASTKPDTFSVTRKLVIKASPDVLFTEINDFHRWKSWSPWEAKDPAMVRTFSGPVAGVGTVYEWNGNNNVGQGRMEIIESNTPQKIAIKLDFIKPIEGHNTAVFTFSPTADGTLVNWEMYGKNSFIGKLMSVFMDMDKMIGTDFEAGLANLKKISETKAQ